MLGPAGIGLAPEKTASPWRPLGAVAVELRRGPAKKSARAVWRNDLVELTIPGRLRRAEEAHLVTLLLWRVLGQGMLPRLRSLAEALNGRHFDRPLGRVAFRHQERRWGSCSSLGNIHLSHRLLMAPAELVEAVLLHELAHLGCLNHGAGFWQNLSLADPACRRRRAELSAYGRAWGFWYQERLRELLSKERTLLTFFLPAPAGIVHENENSRR